jgi:D-methionine transport system ATP-binding protein
MIELAHVSKSFDGREVLHDINLTINDGDIFGIIGASGAGKSTLVRCINLLERPTSGSVLIDGRDVTALAGRDLHQLRDSIGMIFQNFALFSQRSVVQNVCFPLELNKMPKAQRQARAAELLQLVGLEGAGDKYPSQLSGGMQQRVAIARALANKPSIMLCDEATSALDTRTTMQILDLLAEVNRELGVTMVMITHSLAVARRICNRIAVIDDGSIVEQGSTAEVFAHPKSRMTQELIAFDSLTAPAAVVSSAAPAEKNAGDPAAFPGSESDKSADGALGNSREAVR